MKWNCELLTTPALEKMKDLYVNDEIPDVDLAERFNIPVHRLYRLMKKEGVYKLEFKRRADGRSIVGAPLGIESD